MTPRVGHVHANRLAAALEKAQMADEAGELAIDLVRIARKYDISPHTVAKIAVARALAWFRKS